MSTIPVPVKNEPKNFLDLYKTIPLILKPFYKAHKYKMFWSGSDHEVFGNETFGVISIDNHILASKEIYNNTKIYDKKQRMYKIACYRYKSSGSFRIESCDQFEALNMLDCLMNYLNSDAKRTMEYSYNIYIGRIEHAASYKNISDFDETKYSYYHVVSFVIDHKVYFEQYVDTFDSISGEVEISVDQLETFDKTIKFKIPDEEEVINGKS